MPDASRALGAPQVAGTWVNRKGTAKKLVASVAGGQVGGAVGSIAAEQVAGTSRTSMATPDFGRDAYLVVSDDAIALVKTKQGLMKLKVTDEVLARAARADVAGAELGSGKLACPLTITFNDGGRWEFDVPRGGKSAAEAVARSLRG